MRLIIRVMLFGALLVMQCGVLIASTEDFAQKPVTKGRSSIEDVRAFKLKQILDVLKLSDDKQKSFVEIYDAYRKEIHSSITKLPCRKGIQNLSDADLLTNMSANYKNISSVAEIKIKYLTEFSKVLTARQIEQLYRAEGDFGQKMRGAADSRAKGGNSHKKVSCKGKKRVDGENKAGVKVE